MIEILLQLKRFACSLLSYIFHFNGFWNDFGINFHSKLGIFYIGCVIFNQTNSISNGSTQKKKQLLLCNIEMACHDWMHFQGKKSLSVVRCCCVARAAPNSPNILNLMALKILLRMYEKKKITKPPAIE